MAEGKPKAQSGVWSTVKPFVNGGASGMLATCVIQPIDMVKVRIQLGQGSAMQVSKNMIANEGLGSFYKGLSAGLLRQATYTTARLGSFRFSSLYALNDLHPAFPLVLDVPPGAYLETSVMPHVGFRISGYVAC